MFKKIALNVFLNVAIITLLMGIAWSFKNDQYGYATAGILAVTVFIYLKVQLIKTVKKLTDKPKS